MSCPAVCDWGEPATGVVDCGECVIAFVAFSSEAALASIASVALSLCPGQEKRTMCEREVQIGNPG